MLAAVCARFSPDDPLAGLELREVDEPVPPEGWEVVEIRAAALNHHDLFSLRGIGVSEETYRSCSDQTGPVSRSTAGRS